MRGGQKIYWDIWSVWLLSRVTVWQCDSVTVSPGSVWPWPWQHTHGRRKSELSFHTNYQTLIRQCSRLMGGCQYSPLSWLPAWPETGLYLKMYAFSQAKTHSTSSMMNTLRWEVGFSATCDRERVLRAVGRQHGKKAAPSSLSWDVIKADPASHIWAVSPLQLISSQSSVIPQTGQHQH